MPDRKPRTHRGNYSWGLPTPSSDLTLITVGLVLAGMLILSGIFDLYIGEIKVGDVLALLLWLGVGLWHGSPLGRPDRYEGQLQDLEEELKSCLNASPSMDEANSSRIASDFHSLMSFFRWRYFLYSGFAVAMFCYFSWA